MRSHLAFRLRHSSQANPGCCRKLPVFMLISAGLIGSKKKEKEKKKGQWVRWERLVRLLLQGPRQVAAADGWVLALMVGPM
jgi:hypothetical protein